MVNEYNAARTKAGKPALRIELPDFTPDQVERDAIRGFNGYAGTDFFLGSKHLHEFRCPVKDPAGATPSLVVTEVPGQTVGTIEWERVPSGVRPAAFEPYVDNVIRKGDF